MFVYVSITLKTVFSGEPQLLPILSIAEVIQILKIIHFS